MNYAASFTLNKHWYLEKYQYQRLQIVRGFVFFSDDQTLLFWADRMESIYNQKFYKKKQKPKQ